MTRNLKALGLALVAAFAISALLASGAQALKMTASSYPAIVTGEQISSVDHPKHVLIAEKTEVTCEIVKFGGTVESAAKNESITIFPKYEECHTFLGGKTFPATIKMTHCFFVLHGGVAEVIEPEHIFQLGEVDLTCAKETETPHIEIYETAKKHIENKPTCSLTPTQFHNKVGLTYTNTTGGAKKDVDITTNLTNIHTIRSGSILCGNATEELIYKGLSTATAWVDNGIHVSDDPETITTRTYTEGAQLDLTMSK